MQEFNFRKEFLKIYKGQWSKFNELAFRRGNPLFSQFKKKTTRMKIKIYSH